MTSSSKLPWGVLMLVFGLGFAGLVWPSSGSTEGASVSVPVELVADYVHAVIEADRDGRCLRELGAEEYVASPSSIPDGVGPRHGEERTRHTVSIDQPLADQQAQCCRQRV